MEQEKIIQKVRVNNGVRYISIPKKSKLFDCDFVCIEPAEVAVKKLNEQTDEHENKNTY